MTGRRRFDRRSNGPRAHCARERPASPQARRSATANSSPRSKLRQPRVRPLSVFCVDRRSKKGMPQWHPLSQDVLSAAVAASRARKNLTPPSPTSRDCAACPHRCRAHPSCMFDLSFSNNASFGVDARNFSDIKQAFERDQVVQHARGTIRFPCARNLPGTLPSAASWLTQQLQVCRLLRLAYVPAQLG